MLHCQEKSEANGKILQVVQRIMQRKDPEIGASKRIARIFRGVRDSSEGTVFIFSTEPSLEKFSEKVDRRQVPEYGRPRPALRLDGASRGFVALFYSALP